MSNTYEVIRHKPIAHWVLDDNSPFTDHSGYGRSASSVSQPVKHFSLTYGAQYASIFNQTNIATFDAPVYNRGQEDNPFTLAAWVRPVGNTTTGAQQILSKANYDGLSINGTILSFTVSYLANGTASAEYDLGSLQNVFVVGVYNVNTIQLWVNGIRVAETEITEEQREDSFLTVAGSFSHGGSGSDRSIATNSVSIFDYALSGYAIKSIYGSGSRAYERQGAFNAYDGELIPADSIQTDIFASQTWSTSEDWAYGENNNTVVVDDELVPSVQDGVLQEGSWRDSFVIDAGLTSIYAVVPDWSGRGVVVEASLDGTTWVALERGVGVSLIPSGFDPTGKVLQVMVTFTDVDAYMETLTLKGYATGVTSLVNGRTMTLAASYPHQELEINYLDDDWGILSDGGSVTITSTGINYGTYELWIQKTTDTTPGLTPVGTTYINGAASGLTNLRKGEWGVVHRTLTPADADVVISGDFRVGRVVFYPTQFDAASITGIYNSYTGNSVIRADDISVITVTETAQASTIYAHDWAILASG